MNPKKRIASRDDDYVFYKDPRWKKRANCNQGAWTSIEKNMFINFLRENEKIFQTSQLRRATKSFQRLSKYVKKRSPAQCRSHYQKLEQRYGRTIRQVIDGYEKEKTEKQMKEKMKQMKLRQEYKKFECLGGTQDVKDNQAYEQHQIKFNKYCKTIEIKLILDFIQDW